MIRGSRVVIEKLRLQDVYQMMNWKRAEDIIKREYHFLTTRDGDVKSWYDARVKRKNLESFVVKTFKGKVIGFISIRNINWLFKSAVLGITFDLDYVDKGYGTESLKLFLEYYFTELKMRKLYLDVAKHNKRAIRCYEKVGFKLVRQYHARLEEEYYDIVIDELKSNEDAEFRDSFWIVGPFIMIGYYRMQISRRIYKEIYTNIC